MSNVMKGILIVVVGGFVVFLLMRGCSGGPSAEVVPLNQVLDVFKRTLETPVADGGASGKEGDAAASAAAAATSPPPKDSPAGSAGARVTSPGGAMVVDEVGAAAASRAGTEKFLGLFAANLNKAKVLSKPLGVRLEPSGAIVGFTDADKDMTKEAGDDDVFKIEIDPQGGRVIATDLRHGYRRDDSYSGIHGGYYAGGGFFTGYMLGSMMNRQNSYYAQPGHVRPNYRAMSMSPSNYHASAVSRARSSARARGGSGSFGWGK